MLLELFLFFVGLLVIFIGGRWLVEGASKLSLAAGLSPIIIGVTVIGFGTSAPELFLAILSGAQGHGSLSLGNVVGANINNITLIIGVSALITPIYIMLKEVRWEGYMALIASATLLLVSLDGAIDPMEGALMLIMFLVFIIFFVRDVRCCRVMPMVAQEYSEAVGPTASKRKSALLLIAGLVLLIAGTQVMLDAAVNLANELELSELVIGVVVVSFGTVMPELTIGLVAAYRRQTDIAVGNMFGTIIFNSLVVAGAGASFGTIALDTHTTLPAMLMIVLIVAFLLSTLRRWSGIFWRIGFLLLLTYIVITVAVLT